MLFAIPPLGWWEALRWHCTAIAVLFFNNGAGRLALFEGEIGSDLDGSEPFDFYFLFAFSVADGVEVSGT